MTDAVATRPTAPRPTRFPAIRSGWMGSWPIPPCSTEGWGQIGGLPAHSRQWTGSRNGVFGSLT